MKSRIDQIFTGRVKLMLPDGEPSGIFKSAVDGPQHLGTNGLEGDEQADLRYHGGPEKALLIVVTHRVRMPQAQTNEPLQSLAHDTTQVIAVPSRPDAAATDPRPAPTPSQSPSSADEPTQAVPVGAGPSGTGDELTQALPTGSPDAEPTQAIPSGTAQTWNPDDTNPQGRLP